MRNEVVPHAGSVRPDGLRAILREAGLPAPLAEPAGAPPSASLRSSARVGNADGIHAAGRAVARWLAGLTAVCAAAAGLACAGPGRTQVAIGPPPPRETHAVLAGALCQDNLCRCRRDEPGDGGVGVPDTGRKRYEIRLTSPQELWVTVNRQTVLYKSPERAEDCFYVDLSSGTQDVELRASNPDGVSVALQIHELGTRTRSWYDTFAFRCGVPGVCAFEELEAQKAELAGKHNLFDRCGTTKIKGLSWDHGKAPDQLHPSELVVRLTLDIYKFAAWKRHGDDTCGTPGQGQRPTNEPEPPPD
jgi:hypothetical protein